ALGTVKVDNSIISIANATVIYPGNKTNVRDDEDIVVVSNIYDPHGVFPPKSPNGILSVYLDASNIGASSHVDLFDDGNHSDNETDDGVFGTKPITVTTGYSIGTYIITLYAVDNATNKASQQINVRVDNSGPTSCNLLWPIDNTTLEGTVKFMATAYDDAGIKLVEIEVAESGIWDIMNFNENSGSYEIYFDTKTLSDGGPYKIKVRAFDNSGDDPVYDALSFGFFVDNTEPILNINAPRNGDFVDGQYEINISYSDPGLFKPTVEYKIDDTEWLSLATTDDLYWTAIWDTEAEQDGMHTIHFRANDTIGNSVQYSVQVYIDNNPPTCAIVAPVEDEYVQERYTIKVLADDIVGVDYVTIIFMDENYTGVYNPQSGYYELTIDTILIEEGARTVDAIAYDLVGRSTTATQVIFHIDNSAPRMTIVSPLPGEYVSGETKIEVTTSDVYMAISEYKIDGKKWTSTAIPWDTTEVIDGVHTIDIRSYDLLNHQTPEQFIVIVDNNVPTIEIHSPSYGQYVEGTFTFKITAWDYIGVNRVELTFDQDTVNATLNTQTNYYEFTFSSRIYDDGKYNVSATVYDLSGKSNSISNIDFYIDNNDPELVLVSPISGDILKGEFYVEVITSDTFLLKTEYKIDKGGYIDINVPFNSETLADGEHTVTVRSMDNSGHESSLEFTITVDNNPPEISFVTPIAETYYSGYMNVRISAFDSVAVKKVLIRVDGGDPIEIFRSPETGLYETGINTEDLYDGSHNITGEVYDTNGLFTARRIGFLTDNTGPEILIISPGDFGHGEVIFTFNVTDKSGVDVVLLNIDSTGWREITLAEKVDLLLEGGSEGDVTEVYMYDYIWSTLPEDNGKHFYVIKAVDSFGNERVVSEDITVYNEVIVVEEKRDYLGDINKALPLIIFITAIIIFVIIILLFYRGTLSRWSDKGRRRADKSKPGPEGPPGMMPARERPGKGKGRRRKGTNDWDYDYDSEQEDSVDFDKEFEFDDDFVLTARGARRPKGRGAKGARKVVKKKMVKRPPPPGRGKGGPPRKAPKRTYDEEYEEAEGEGEEVAWD
ncbi:MAG: hypothetical protein JSV49_05745, partial [Thermoplasmata archaeon]